MKLIRELTFKVISLGYRHLQGKAIAGVPFVSKAFRLLIRLLITEKVVLADFSGHKMYLNPLDSHTARMLLFTGGYEKYQTVLFKALVREGMVVIDLGANIGYYTLVAAARVVKGVRYLPLSRNQTITHSF